MRNSILLAFFLSIFVLSTNGQESNLQNVVKVDNPVVISQEQLSDIMRLEKGASFSLKINGQQLFQARINMNVLNDPYNHTIGAEIRDIPESYFTLNEYIKDGIKYYSGEIVSRRSAEAYIIFTDKSLNTFIQAIAKDKVIAED